MKNLTIQDLKDAKEEVLYIIKADGYEKHTKAIMTKMVENCSFFSNIEELTEDAMSYFDKYEGLRHSDDIYADARKRQISAIG